MGQEMIAERQPHREATSVRCVQALQRTEVLLSGKLAQRFRPHGLSVASFNVLIVLYNAGRSLSPCDIGEQLLVTRGTVTGLLDSLERQRLVRRLPHPEDRRMLLIELTEPGRSLLAQLLPEHHQGMSDALGGLSQPEQEALLQMLDKVQAHLLSSCPSDPSPCGAQDLDGSSPKR